MYSWFFLASCMVVAVFSLPTQRTTLSPACLDECLPCSDTELDCPNGKVKDECGCCEQCLRKMGEPCGMGDGVCGNELVCLMRMNGGICQPILCGGVSCGEYQTCVEKEDGTQSCECAFNCTEATETPFCDEFNGQQYKSMCDIQLRECQTGMTLVYLPGECKKCEIDGKTYNEGEIVQRADQKDNEDTPCVYDVCKQGSIQTFEDKTCLRDLNYTCVLLEGEGRSIGGYDDDDMKCALGFACKITKWSKQPYTYPHLGECVKISEEFCYHMGKEINRNKTYVTEDCKNRCVCMGNNIFECGLLCPPDEKPECGSDETMVTDRLSQDDTSCRCAQSRCAENMEVCLMEKKQGECYAYFEKWFYNPTTEECEMFVYGGCNGNENRFNSKPECEKKCVVVPVVVEDIVPAEPLKSRPVPSGVVKLTVNEQWKWPKAKPAEIKKSTLDMMIKGNVIFGGLKQELSSPSCLFVFLEDISRMDAQSTLIGSRTFNVSGFNTANNFMYSMNVKKPAKNQLRRRFGMAATVHVGYCPDKRSSIRTGDYITNTVHQLKITETDGDYVIDINLTCFDCKTKDLNSNKRLSDVVENKSKLKLLGNEGPCKFEGKTYQFLEQFSDQACKGLCRCGVNGKVSCVPLCAPVETCKENEVQDITTIRHSQEPRCNCKVSICTRKECLHNGVKYPVNKRFVDQTCQGYCKCDINGSIGCVSLCPPSGARCEPGQEKVPVKEPVPDSNCTCDREICVNTTVSEQSTDPLIIEEDEDEDIEYNKEEVEHPFEFPYEEVLSDVKLDENKTIQINGKVMFSRNVGTLPTPSCMKIKLEDVSLQDAPAFLIKETTIDLSGRTLGDEYAYEIVSYKPIEEQLTRDHSMSVVLNVGWCEGMENSTDWIRTGDFLDTAAHNVRLNAENDVYNVDIKAECNRCDKETEEEKLEKVVEEECLYKGVRYPVNKRFVDQTCEGYCKCELDGSIGCVSLCPPSMVSCEPGQEKVLVEEPVPDSDCTCDRETCINVTIVSDDIFKAPLIIEEDEDEDENMDDTTKEVETPFKRFGFPFGRGAPDVKLDENKIIQISGKVMFSRNVGTLPTPSCMKIKFKDISLQDASSFTIKETTIDLSGKTLGDEYAYSLTSYKPIEEQLNALSHSMSVVLNVGWCEGMGNSTDWIRVGDFLNTETHYVFWNAENDTYNIDIKAECYDCEDKKTECTSLCPPTNVLCAPGQQKTVTKETLPGTECICDKEICLNPTIVSDDTAAPVDDDKETESPVDDDKETESPVDDDKETESPADDNKETESTDHGWPYGRRASDVKLDENKTVLIGGKVMFSKNVGTLPTPSCIKIKFRDISLQDAPAFLIKETTIDVSGKTLGDEYAYEIVSNKPIEKQLTRDHSMSVVLNVGWCQEMENSMEWLRAGDFLNTATHYVRLNAQNDTYYVNVEAECYSCDDENAKDTTEGKISDEVVKEVSCYDLEKNATRRALETWKKEDNCTTCICIKGVINCSAPICETKCDEPVIVEGECCPVCSPPPTQCYDKENERVYANGELWKRDPCTSCSCDNGVAICAVQDCALPMCENPVLKEGSCCPTCEEEQCYDDSMGRFYTEGEEWYQANGCTQCRCWEGKPMCASPMCVKPECEAENATVVTVDGICCPICSNTKVCTANDGKKYVENRIWQENDSCQICQCQGDGGVKCLTPGDVVQKKACPSKTTLNKQCKPVCYDKIQQTLSTTKNPEP